MAANNATGAGADEAAADLRRHLPAEASTAALEAALQKYEDVSLRGAVRPTSGSGQSHAGITLPTGWVSLLVYELRDRPSFAPWNPLTTILTAAWNLCGGVFDCLPAFAALQPAAGDH